MAFWHRQIFLLKRQAPFVEVLMLLYFMFLFCNFNIHVDDCNNADGKRFLNLIESLGLQNHVTSVTYLGGHALDLVMSRSAEI